MTISHLLEDFSDMHRGTPVALTDVSLEEQKLESFEKGYQAGWDDAVKSGTDDARHISADLAQNLSDLSFTYEEAHQAALVSMKSLLDQMIQTILPKLVQHTLGLQLSEQLSEIISTGHRLKLEIVCAPNDHPALDKILDEAGIPNASLAEDSSLADGQVYIRFGDQEREINLSETLAAMDQAISGFYNEHQRETA